mgnify:CR=1 FL=1
MHNDKKVAKDYYLDWRLAIRNFISSEKLLHIKDINVRVVSFSEKIKPIGHLREIICNDIHLVRGFIWVESGLDKNVPCFIYDTRKLFCPQSNLHFDINYFCSNNALVNTINQACIDAEYSGNKSVVIFESNLDPYLIGWMVETISPINISKPNKNDEWLPKKISGRY